MSDTLLCTCGHRVITNPYLPMNMVVQRIVDESKAAQLASKPVTAPDALSGYGATMFSGGSY